MVKLAVKGGGWVGLGWLGRGGEGCDGDDGAVVETRVERFELLPDLVFVCSEFLRGRVVQLDKKLRVIMSDGPECCVL